MIKSRVKKGHAIIYCTECGAEHTLVQYKGEAIDFRKIESAAHAFSLKHAICRQVDIQASIKFL